MTRRERLERKVERRHEWADKRRTNANAVLASHEPFRHDIAFNTQPGHIPFRARIIAQEDRAFESLKVADHHESKAEGLASQLERTIFSDDSNATEALEARIAENEAKRENMKKINAMYRKGNAEGLAAVGLDLEQLREKLKTAYSWCQQPYPAYELQNLGQRISGDKKRLGFIKKQQETHAQAEAAPNGVILKEYGEWCSVTFAEKPDRSILDALRNASFRWGSGSWSGKTAELPAEVKSLLEVKS
jgi:Domain of unknown function (DUF3560)